MHPIMIAGAALVGLPIVLHLILKQEPKRLVFPALRFLKQKQKTSERKMRLRHLLLLLLRCLLIALFAVTLYQPTVLSTGTINLAGEQPVAAVLILDTSPSMGYKAGGAGPSRSDEAIRLALDFVDELPKNSRVAVIDPNDPIATWEPTLLEARSRIQGLKEPAGYAPPITSTLAVAYQLLKTADQDAGDQAEPMPRLVAVFSDRAANCWDASRLDELKALRDSTPPPTPVQIFFDVGDKAPSNVAILKAEMKPQRVSGSADATVNVLVRADGVDATDTELIATLDGAPLPDQVVALTPGRPKAAPIKFKTADLKPGFHTVEVRLKREDGLVFDNVRTVTFEVGTQRKILTISDNSDTAEVWKLACDVLQEFDCTVVTPDQATDFAGYEAVTLLAVRAPDERLAKRLTEYVRGGGKLMVIPDGPGSEEARADAYNQNLSSLLPAVLGKLRGPDPNDAARKNGVPWKLDDDADLRHPLFAPFREWKRQGNIEVFDPKRRRLAKKYRETNTDGSTGAVVAYYDDSDDPKTRTPALLEQVVGSGRVLLLTTRFDVRADSATDPLNTWNDYADYTHSWAMVFPWAVLRYLCGSPDDAAYTFTTGQDVTVPLPPFAPGQARKVIVEGPGILPRDAVVELGERQTELRLTPPKTLSAGVYTLRPADEKIPWAYRFSLNTATEESGLEKVPEEAITALFGKNSVATVDRDVKFRDLLETKFDQPVELFPLLMLLVLLFFAVEGLMANRFYKLK